MYELNGFSRAPRITKRGILAPGDAGIAQTLGVMRELAREGARDQTVRSAAILATRSVRPHDLRGELDALHRFVRDHIRFVRDPRGVETLQAPWVTLYYRAGDCDDRATLLAALAASIGIDADFRFRVVAANPARRGEFSHVYLVAQTPEGPIAMDPTYGENRLGFELPGHLRRADFPVSYARGSLQGPPFVPREGGLRAAFATRPLTGRFAASTPAVVRSRGFAQSPIPNPPVSIQPQRPTDQPVITQTVKRATYAAPVQPIGPPSLSPPVLVSAPPQDVTPLRATKTAITSMVQRPTAGPEPVAADRARGMPSWLPLAGLALLGLFVFRKGL